MNTRTFLYSLRTIDGKPVLCIDLMANILSENSDSLELQLPNTIPVKLSKYEYLNKDKVWDNGSNFFYVCSKQVNRDYIFNKLIDYACTKINVRIDYLNALRDSYKKQKRLLKAA